MGEEELERAVRESLRRQADLPRPLPVDPADLAIRRANRTLRRRTLSGVALAAVATTLITAGAAQIGGEADRSRNPVVVLGDPVRPSAGPSRSVPPAVGAVRAEVDLIVGTSLGTSEGEQLELEGLGPIERAQRLPEDGGWLVLGAPTAAGRTLWVVQPDGGSQVLLAGAQSIVVAPDGRRVAWRDSGQILTAGVVGRQLVATAATAVPGAAQPVGVAGDTVLIRRAADRPGLARWRPAQGSPGTLLDAALHVYGSRPDGRLVGQLLDQAGRRCLALLDPTGRTAPTGVTCLPLAADGLGGVSAEGRWLLVNGTRSGQDSPEALLVDLDSLGAEVSVRPAGPALTGAVAWGGSRTAHYVEGAGNLVRIRVDQVLTGARGSSTSLAGTGPQRPPVVVVPSRP